MAIFRTLVILVLVGLIMGGAAYFSYKLFWKPRILDEADKEAKVAQAEPSPPPDYSLSAYEKAKHLLDSGDIDGGRAALREFVHSYPDSTKLAEAKGTLGNVNMARIFSPEESAEKVPYAVVSGDSLVRIASHFKTNAELIFRINNLETINLKIGQPLLIPQVDPSIEVDRAAGTVTLLNHGEFLKEYQVLSLKIPGKAGPVTTKVMDKLALQGSDRVAFGDKRYAGCERWVMLATNGIALRGQIEGTPTPAGILLSQPDMEEIFLLVARGTPVTIK